MIEDKSFNSFIKAKLEEDVGDVPAVIIPGGLFGRHRWSAPYLLAASLLLVCGMFAVHFASDDGRREFNVAEAIELLDESSVTSASDTPADRLLAWQDAPYAEILD